MIQKLRNRDEGFTIIEVLIVLAIAGLILLIVFLAVPALQRSSRNTQRKNDASAIGGAIANFISNNGGSLPVSLGNNADATSLDVCSGGGAATGGTTACTGNLETAKLGYYTPAQVSLETNTANDKVVAQNAVRIDIGVACNATNTQAGATTGGRTAAILYAVESGSATTSSQCVEQ